MNHHPALTNLIELILDDLFSCATPSNAGQHTVTRALLPKPQRPPQPQRQVQTSTENTIESATTSIINRRGTVFDYEVDCIEVNAKLFQFKRMAKANGSVGSLSGVKTFDPDLCGVLLCWNQPGTGKIYVVNGHNRLELAQQLGVKTLPIKLINVNNFKEARFKGALANIAEKSCDIYDVAKFFRENHLSETQLKDLGIAIKQSLTRDAIATTKLSDTLFDAFLRGEMAVHIAVAIGNSELSEEQQNMLWTQCLKCIEQGKEITSSLINDFIDAVLVSETYQQSDLFGNSWSQNYIYEYSLLCARIKREFKKNIKVFGTAAKNSDDLSSVKDQNINANASAAISMKNQKYYNTFCRESRYIGPLATLLNRFAKLLHEGKDFDINKVLMTDIQIILDNDHQAA